MQRRQALKGQIAATIDQLQAATTDAETQKLQGVLTGQAAQLQAIGAAGAVAAKPAAGGARKFAESPFSRTTPHPSRSGQSKEFDLEFKSSILLRK